jgi:hypothetical protein
MRSSGLGLALAALVTALPARADRQTVGLTYVTPTEGDCPTEAELRTRLARELGYDPFVTQTDHERSIRIEIRRGASFAARLVDRAPSGEERARELSSTSGCSDLVDSVVLAIAVALDADTRQEPSPPARPSLPSPPQPPTVVMVPVYLDKPRPPPRPTSAAPDRLEGVVAVGFGGGAGFVPGVSVGATLALGIRRRQWEIAVEGTAHLPGTSANALGSVEIVSGMGSLVPCFTPRLADGVHAMLCGNVAVGAAFVSGEDLTGSFDATVVTAFTGPRGGVEVRLSPRFDLRLVGELLGNLAPIEATAEIAETSVTLYEAPPVAGRVVTSISVSFP